jgi:hypothetical protein
MITPFLFYFPKVPADDFPAQRTAIDTAEIGLEVSSRINIQTRCLLLVGYTTTLIK